MAADRKTILNLNVRTVAHLTVPPGKTDFVYWDDTLPGFGRRFLLSNKGKTRVTWIVQYRLHNGTSRRMTFANGSFPAHEARKVADKLLAEVKTGGDPQGEKARKRARRSHLFGAVVEKFLKIGETVGIRNKGKPWRPSSAYQYRNILQAYCASLNGMEIESIGRAELNNVIRHVLNKHGRRSADLTRDRLFTLFHWAVCEGILDANPVLQTHKVDYDTKRERILSHDELKRIWRACEPSPENFPFGGRFGDAVQMLFLTGARRSEVTGMKWDEVDLDNKGNEVWTLPAERSKNGHKHLIPLSLPAVAILKRLQQEQRWNGREHVSDACVFTTFGKMNVHDRKKQLYERSGTKDWWLHDIRKTVATGMARIGIAPHVIECCLNHVSGFRMNIGGFAIEVPASRPPIARKYNLHPYEAEMAQAFTRWAEHVMALVEDRPDKVAALASHKKG